MDITQITSSLGFIGNKISEVTQWAILNLSNLGLKTTVTTAKILNMLILSLLLYITIKFIHFMRKPLKWVIVILLGLMVASIIISFIN